MPAITITAHSDESDSQAILARWYANDGQHVEVDEPLCALETDKATIDVPAPSAGILRQLKREGGPVRIGEEVARIDPN